MFIFYFAYVYYSLSWLDDVTEQWWWPLSSPAPLSSLSWLISPLLSQQRQAELGWAEQGRQARNTILWIIEGGRRPEESDWSPHIPRWCLMSDQRWQVVSILAGTEAPGDDELPPVVPWWISLLIPICQLVIITPPSPPSPDNQPDTGADYQIFVGRGPPDKSL